LLTLAAEFVLSGFSLRPLRQLLRLQRNDTAPRCGDDPFAIDAYDQLSYRAAILNAFQAETDVAAGEDIRLCLCGYERRNCYNTQHNQLHDNKSIESHLHLQGV
jgi:hypothetical protein